MLRQNTRALTLERLEQRHLLCSLGGWSPGAGQESAGPDPGSSARISSSIFTGRLPAGGDWHNGSNPYDVNGNSSVEPADALRVLECINARRFSERTAEAEFGVDGPYVDVNDDGYVSPGDILKVIDFLNSFRVAAVELEDPIDPSQITTEDVRQLLDRGAAASASEGAIIAIVDRGGRILGVRVEDDVHADFDSNGNGTIDSGTDEVRNIVFAIDGAIAKARTAALFSSSAAPLTSRTIRFISQSTITQREVESNPNILDLNSTRRGPGFVAPIGVGGHFPPEIAFAPQVDLFAIEHQSRDSARHAGPDLVKGTADDVWLQNRFNVDPGHASVQLEFPESYGVVSGILHTATSRGLATLPGGMPLYKQGELVGGVGVFFPGPDGFATHEQGFVPEIGQAEKDRLNAARVLESEWIAYATAGGSSGAPGNGSVGTLNGVPGVGGYDLPFGRIDLVGVTLEIFGPHPDRENRLMGFERLIQVGSQVGRGEPRGTDMMVAPGKTYLQGRPVPTGWLVEPHDSLEPGGLTEQDVRLIVRQGIDEADRVRAAIRLTPDGRPGERTRMVFAVADRSGEVLGLFRMEDATIFSIDVAVAKARNTAYYADASDVLAADLIDDDRDGDPDVPAGVALTNRTFRFLSEPRFPTGAENVTPGAFSILRDPGIDPSTAENDGPALPASVYSDDQASVLAFDAFNPARNFREGGVSPAPTFAEREAQRALMMNQNGVVFFPGSTPLYKRQLVGGFGVSGDGVDQDDVVTASGQTGFEPPVEIRSDQYLVRGVRLPFQKFLRNPHG